MDTVIEYIRYSADKALTVPDLLQLRPISTTFIMTEWSGVRQGLGTQTTPITFLLHNGPSDGYQVNPRYRQVTAKEVAVSNGLLRDRDIVIGPICYPYALDYATGGIDPLFFTPQVTSNNEVYFLLQGTDLPVGGVKYKLINNNTQRNVMYRLYLRSVAAI